MNSNNHDFKKSFENAAHGIGYVIKTQKNAKIHAFITLLVIILGIWLNLGLIEWAVLVLTFSIVWTAEIFNTAIEAAVDLASPNIHPMAKIAKDTSAGAVLAASFFSAIIGLILLGPPLLSQITELLTRIAP